MLRVIDVKFNLIDGGLDSGVGQDLLKGPFRAVAYSDVLRFS